MRVMVSTWWYGEVRYPGGKSPGVGDGLFKLQDTVPGARWWGTWAFGVSIAIGGSGHTHAL